MASQNYKRAMRHRNQTNDFFSCGASSLDQGPGDGKVRSSAEPNREERHCPTSHVCVGSSTCPGMQRQYPEVQGKPVQITFLDMHYGLGSSKPPAVAGNPKSPSEIKVGCDSIIHPWDAYDALPSSLRQKAARETITHLGKIVKAYMVYAEDAAPEALPFLNEEQLIEMIHKTVASIRSIVESRRPRGSKRPQDSSFTPVAEPIPNCTTYFGIDPSLVAAGEDEKWEQEDDVEYHRRSQTTRNWGGLLMKENRKVRESWILEVERGDEAASSRRGTPATKTIYEAIKAENEFPLQLKLGSAGFDSDLERSIQRTMSTTFPPPNSNDPYAKDYSRMLANPYFVPIAGDRLKEWCVRRSIVLGSYESGEQFLKLVRKATVLPIHAWISILPPVWNEEKESWVWKDMSSTKPSRKYPPISFINDSDMMDVVRQITGSSLETDNNSDGIRDASPSHGAKSKQPEQVIGTFKDEKRAPARKEKKIKNDERATKANEAKSPAKERPRVEADTRPLTQDVKYPEESRNDISTSSEVVLRRRRPYRFPAAPRVGHAKAMLLASKGQLLVSMCPVLTNRVTDRLLKACAYFWASFTVSESGSHPAVVTRFLMKVGLKPSQFMEALELERFLQVVRKLERLETLKEDPDDATQADKSARPQDGICQDALCEECKEDDRAAAAAAAITASSDAEIIAPLADFDSIGPISYPDAPTKPSCGQIISWAQSLSGAQLASLQTNKDRTLALRALSLGARLFISHAASHLTPQMFERVVSPSSNILTAIDLPVAKYTLGRMVIFTQTLRQSHARYRAESRRNRRRGAPHDPVPDYAVRAARYLNSRYHTVSEIVVRSRRFVYSTEDVKAVISAAKTAVEDVARCEMASVGGEEDDEIGGEGVGSTRDGKGGEKKGRDGKVKAKPKQHESIPPLPPPSESPSKPKQRRPKSKTAATPSSSSSPCKHHHHHHPPICDHPHSHTQPCTTLPARIEDNLRRMGAGMDMDSLATHRAEGVMLFLQRWPMLEDVVLGVGEVAR